MLMTLRTLLVPQHCDVQLADELEHVINWSKANKLKLNLEKTKEIVLDVPALSGISSLYHWTTSNVWSV